MRKKVKVYRLAAKNIGQEPTTKGACGHSIRLFLSQREASTHYKLNFRVPTLSFHKVSLNSLRSYKSHSDQVRLVFSCLAAVS